MTRPKNSFEFVTVASARAKQLLEGCVPKVDGSPKPARRAVHFRKAPFLASDICEGRVISFPNSS